MPYKINTAVPNFTIGNFIKISDGSTVTTGTVTATRTVAGSSAPCSGTAAYDSGRKAWKIALSTADMNGLDVHYNFALAGCIPIDFEIRTVAKFVSDLNDFNRLTEAVADVTLVATTTTNTDMVGTAGANTTTPPTVDEISDKISADMVNDPTIYPVNVKEVNGTAQDANNNSADINTLIANQSNWATATSVDLNTDAIDSAALSAAGLTDIKNSVWSEVMTELTGPPLYNATLKDAIIFLLMALRNEQVQNSGTGIQSISNNAGTPIADASLTDSGGVFTKAKYT